jgi:hypothetical protein
MNDTGLLVLLGLLHLFALAAGGGLLLLALGVHDTCPPPPPRDDDEGGGGGGGGGGSDERPLHPPGRPIGGPPLRDARPARVRLRGPQRLADLLPRPSRRSRPHVPSRPSRTR